MSAIGSVSVMTERHASHHTTLDIGLITEMQTIVLFVCFKTKLLFY